MRAELKTCTDPRQRWMVAKTLLYNEDRPTKQSSVIDDIGRCEQFSEYSVCKIEQLRHNIVLNCLKFNFLSLCHMLANYLTKYHLSLLTRLPNCSHPYCPNSQFLTYTSS